MVKTVETWSWSCSAEIKNKWSLNSILSHSNIFMACSDDLTITDRHTRRTESIGKTADETSIYWSRYKPIICLEPLRTNTTNVSQNGRYFNTSLNNYRRANLFRSHISFCTSAHADSSQRNNRTGWWRYERPVSTFPCCHKQQWYCGPSTTARTEEGKKLVCSTLVVLAYVSVHMMKSIMKCHKG